MTVTEAGLTFTIAATPGHTLGGVCIIGDGVVFVGDTIFLNPSAVQIFPAVPMMISSLPSRQNS